MIEGGHYDACHTANRVGLKVLNIIGKRDHFGHFMLDFFWPVYHWLYTRGRLYDTNLEILCLDDSIEKFRSIIDDVFHCRIITGFDYSEYKECYKDMILGMEGHNRKIFRLALKDYFSSPLSYRRHFRQYVINKLGLEVGKSDKFVLVQRKIVDEDRGGGRRNMSNHEHLAAALGALAEMEGMKFVNVQLEDMSFSEQVKLFAESRVVVGQHGAGLCHFLWMPVCSMMQELHHTDSESYRFGQFCYDFDIGHSNMVCPLSSDGKSIDVPVNELVISLQKKLEEYNG